MYLSSSEIAQGRQDTLNNFQTASAACVSASGRLVELFMRVGRYPVENLVSPPCNAEASMSGFWLSGMQSRSAQVLGEWLEIIGDTQQTVITTAAAQTRMLDGLVVSTLDRARASSPAEVLPVLDTLQHSIKQTDQSIGNWSDVARQSVSMIESSFSEPFSRSGVKQAKGSDNQH